ncbi:MAG: DUF1572 domain-containing protein [Bacteroidetes bacterium]|nr:MAG: DUF1572 domain-containing protein [Bacteroidota bacterium]
MNLTANIAKLFRDVYFGGNWTAVNFKETLADVNWQVASTKVSSFNTIAALVYHTNYYVNAVLSVLKGTPLSAHDKFSFDHPPILNEADWEKLLDKSWKDAEKFAREVEALPEEKLWEVFVVAKYGNYYRNLHGVIEHCHYHLGQIVLIKKLVAMK